MQIIVLLFIADGAFGYKTFGYKDLDEKLQMINRNPSKFKKGIILVLIEHLTIILLAIMLFIAFSPYNLILGIVWCVCRIVEALIQIYSKRNYWGLLNIAVKYSDSGETEKKELFDLSSRIHKTKDNIFCFAQILFSIGTIAYSVLFVIYGVVPAIIGWFGIVASILYSLGNGLFLIKPETASFWGIGGLLILIFEAILGGWLLFFA